MTTSASRFPTSSLLLLAPALLLAAACGEEGDGSACADNDPPTVTGISSKTLIYAKVSLEELKEYSAAGAMSRSSTILAAFRDTTQVLTLSPSPDFFFGEGCYLKTGIPTSECRKGYTAPCLSVPVDVDRVEVSGLYAGASELKQTSAGTFLSDLGTAPLYGKAKVTVSVTGAQTKGHFPSYEQSLVPPQELELLQPDPTSGAAVGTNDFKVTWPAGNGDVVYLDIAPTNDPTNDKDKVQCKLRDDGCHRVEAAILDWLKVEEGDTFSLSLTRLVAGVRDVPTDKQALLTVTSQVKAVLTR